jgi:mannose-6-phosphate isomerase-like protein (cupin superfamily)
LYRGTGVARARRESMEVMKPTEVKPARLFSASRGGATFRQRLTPLESNLDWLNCGEYALPPETRTQGLTLPGEEALLFQWSGRCDVLLNDRPYSLALYDTLYVPRGSRLALVNNSEQPAALVQMSAPAQRPHPAFHSEFADFSRREERIRHLKGKDVYMMFDVSEPAEKLVAGYTFFQPFQRSWPPHNHTDQEEIYFFIEGHGAMEVYETPEALSFVHEVNCGDAVSIPRLNYHPVFSQQDPLKFIWCIAGERYWVGDKNRAFMTGNGDAITT